ncbi:hypothetical protein ACFV5N_01565 [Streptomyces sp. NPDC059853]|uniref:hypothetical protein n=1 Tax=Streptomyces sp. NPDC059853 TaxID=3346973 RepID=UPI00364B1882
MSELLPLAEEAEKKLTEYTVTPGVLGFVVFAALGVAVWVLLKSMSRQLGRIDFKEQERAERLEGPGGPDGGSGRDGGDGGAGEPRGSEPTAGDRDRTSSPA